MPLLDFKVELVVSGAVKQKCTILRDAPAGPPFTGPPPVNSLSAWAMVETSSGVKRWPAAAARLMSFTVGSSWYDILISAAFTL